MAVKRITKTAVDGIKSGATVWDAEIKGFGVRRQKRDAVYVLKYVIQGRQRFATIGKHGSPWTPEMARKQAQVLLDEVAKGIDVAGERSRKRAAPTVAELARDFLERHAQTKLKSGTVRNYEYQIRLSVIPNLGKLRVETVTTGDIAKLHHDLRGTPYEANRVLALLSKMFNWAETQGYRAGGTNPVRNIERFKEDRRERFLSTEELAQLGVILADAERDSTESLFAIAAIRLLIFTGARLREITTLRWEHVDLERGLLLLPDSKTGRKTLHISAPAAQILESLPRIDGNPYVCVGSLVGGHISDLGAIWERIRKRAGLDDVRLHDLRHSFASVAAARGGSLPMIGKLLGHTQARTTQRYAHLGANPVREFNEKVGEAIASAMGGTADRSSAEIVPLRKSP